VTSGNDVRLHGPPRRLVALGKADVFRNVPGSAVKLLNTIQIAKAQRFVFMRPGSGLEAAVLSQRPPGSGHQ
jgi:hypothetical protein